MSTEQQVHQTEDKILFVRLHAGEAEAWEEFLDRYGNELHTYFVPLTPTAEQAEDLLSDTLLALVRSAQKLTLEGDDEFTLTGWVWGIAKQSVRDFWYAQAQRITTLGIVGGDYQINAFWPNLSDQQKVIVFLRYAQSLPIHQIGELLGLSLSAIHALFAPVRYLSADYQDQLKRLVILTLAMPKKAEMIDPHLLVPVYPMLLLQKQLCQQHRLVEEAGIFERAQQKIEHLSTIPIHDFLAELQTIEELMVAKDPGLLIRELLELFSEHDNRRQPL